MSPELYTSNTIPEIIFKLCGCYGMQIYLNSPHGSVTDWDWRAERYTSIRSAAASFAVTRVERLRKRPKETSSKAKTTRALFGKESTKVPSIPVVADGYNYYMGVVDEFDHLTAQNAGLRQIERGGIRHLSTGY
jgi:hypothetical protein